MSRNVRRSAVAGCLYKRGIVAAIVSKLDPVAVPINDCSNINFICEKICDINNAIGVTASYKKLPSDLSTSSGAMSKISFRNVMKSIDSK